MNLRAWLDDLRRHGQLGEVRSRITPDQDVAAVLEHADGSSAVLFTDVEGSEFPLAGNLVPGRDALARAAGCAPAELAGRYAQALREPRPCTVIDAAQAPVFRHRLHGDVLSRLPLTVQHEHDAGYYLTAGLVLVRDPVSGKTNLSINRMQVVGDRRLGVLVLPGRLRRILGEAESRGQDLDLAIVVGVDPLLGLASQAPADREIDDLEVASALRATPLPVAPCPGSGLLVPAEAEFVLEARFRANQRVQEGPFGEFPRTYGPAGSAPLVEVLSCRHRPDAVFQTILSGGREHFLLGGIPREATLLRTLREAHFDVTSVRLTEAGSCRLHAIVALRAPGPGVGVNALLITLGALTTVKHAIVVDDDVDIFDDEQVGWAMATRVQADRDVVIIPGARGSSLDPSSAGTTAKMGINATAPATDRDRHARMRTAPKDPGKLDRYLVELSRRDATGDGVD
ncbi:UbiD family decarboxylase [Amycolatopsis pithecellobii]|uniref:UbiD family decarboxylase n=1 Tax=Amycolatopsis pithecellobii TaxID=664692 RepID=UPI00140D1631|nr:UbiD family decarboxylase [Amycolatopsis pithecellobii]